MPDQRCTACELPIKRVGNTIPLKCASCDKVCHLKTTCSGIKRRTKNPVWLCADHNEMPPIEVQQQIQTQLDQERKCESCNQKFREGTTPLKCTSCDIVCHSRVECSGITRGVTQQGNAKWKCTAHRPKTTTSSRISQRCNACNKAIRYNSNPFKCVDCSEVCHKITTCSNIPAYSLLKWRCKVHSRATPPDAGTHAPTQDANAKLNCHVCKATIRKGLTPLKCVECDRVCHHKQSCSNIKRTYKSSVWNCPEHSNTAPPAVALTIPNANVTPAEPIAEVQQLQDEGTTEKVKCSKCKKNIRSNITPIACMDQGCNERYHKICSGLTKTTFEKYHNKTIHWSCEKCIERKASSDHQTIHNANIPVTSDKKDSKLNTRKSLRILQWNAEGIASKIHELREVAKDIDLDVIMIQESKLSSNHKTPSIPEYVPIRVDRKHKEGGGIITYIKSSLVYERKQDEAKDATETSTFSVKMSANKWVQITNLYCTPSTSLAHQGQDIRLATEIIPIASNSLIGGDFNAHSGLWDPIQPTDNRGNELEDWMIDNDLTILNEGDSTRINRATGGLSTPDITFCGSNWSNKTTWQTIDGIGNSDHTPILIEIHGDVKHNPIFQGQAKWKSKNVDWKPFQDEIDRNVAALDSTDNIKERVRRFNKILSDAAAIHVGKVTPGKRTKCWSTPPVRAAIHKRNRLRHLVRTQRKEWLEACREAQEEIRKAKEESWKELLEDTVTEADDTKMWRLIKSLNGTPCANAPNEVMVQDGKRITTDKQKANTFVKHYANVSRLKFSKEDRDINRDLKKQMGRVEPDPSAIQFTLAELKKAIKKMKKNGAAGPDNIPPSFLKNLAQQPCKSS